MNITSFQSILHGLIYIISTPEVISEMRHINDLI